MDEHPPTQPFNTETKDEKFLALRTKIKKFSWLPFVLILFLFFFPFIEISAMGHISFTGLQLAFGTTMRKAALFGPGELTTIESYKTVLLALLLAAAGIGLPFIKGKLGSLLPAISSSDWFSSHVDR